MTTISDGSARPAPTDVTVSPSSMRRLRDAITTDTGSTLLSMRSLPDASHRHHDWEERIVDVQFGAREFLLRDPLEKCHGGQDVAVRGYRHLAGAEDRTEETFTGIDRKPPVVGIAGEWIDACHHGHGGQHCSARPKDSVQLPHGSTDVVDVL